MKFGEKRLTTAFISDAMDVFREGEDIGDVGIFGIFSSPISLTAYRLLLPAVDVPNETKLAEGSTIAGCGGDG